MLRGRYELLLDRLRPDGGGHVAADRFTVAGLGEDFTTNLGLNYRRVVTLGLVIVSMVSALRRGDCRHDPLSGVDRTQCGQHVHR
ncbi:hypothetical protein VXQ18_15610 [Brucella abortus]|nr:hypothetical protein [Brucella abortus]